MEEIRGDQKRERVSDFLPKTCQFQFLKTPCEIELEKDKQCVAYALARSNVCVSTALLDPCPYTYLCA